MILYFIAGFIAGFAGCILLGKHIVERMNKRD